jgi:hypothetical protein
MADPQQQQQQPEPERRPTAEFLPPDRDFDVEAARSLGELAVNQELTVTQERSLFGDLITAQPIRRYRDDAKILQRIDVWAAMAGPRWFYRYPVRNRRTGKVEYIEGPSVKATNAVARLFGNCSVESRTMRLDEKQYICYSRFGDLETGFSITKGQLVPRSATLGGEDEERRQAIAHNVGQSKSQRNVVDAALGDFTNRAFQSAKASIVDRIGRNLEGSRERIVELLLELGREKGISTIVTRVEYVTGRKVNEWLAPDIAGIHAEIEAIRDGFASIDEQWPLPAPPEPRRGDAAPETPAAVPPTTGASHTPAAAGAAAASAPPLNPGSEPPPPNDEFRKPASVDVAGERKEGPAIHTPAPPPDEPSHHPHAHGEPAQARDWTVPPNIVGQDNIIRALTELLDMTESDVDQDEFEKQNAERIARLTGTKGAQFRAQLAAKRRGRGGGGA